MNAMNKKEEIVSLNEGLFSLTDGNLIGELDQLLELAAPDTQPICQSYGCPHQRSLSQVSDPSPAKLP